jgi:ABC-type uncharacterized transport system auxiliary subunit
MTRRREYPLNLQISLESLPPPASLKRDRRLVLRFSQGEVAKIERTARKRGEQPAALCRTIILTAFQDSALRALGRRPDLLGAPPAEQLRALLEVFALGDSPPEGRTRREPLPPPPTDVRRNKRMMARFTEGELAMVERAADERGELPAVLMRAIILKAFENSARRAIGRPDVLDMSLTEQQKVLLDALTFK